MKRILISVLVCLTAVMLKADVLTNETIISMLQKGYSSEVIIGFMDNAEDCQLSADIDAVDALLAAGASNDLIVNIQQRVKKQNTLDSGLYWWNTGDKPMKLSIVPLTKESKGIGGGLLGSAISFAGTAVGVNTGSFGTMASSWIAGDVLSSSGFKSEKLVLTGEHSQVQVSDKNAVFRFVLPESVDNNIAASDLWYYTWLSGIQSPNEFQVIKLQPKGKGKKAKRSFPSGLSWSAAGFSTSGKISEKNLVDFEVRQINNRTFEISFPGGLEAGEYAFFYKNALSEVVKDHLSAFDFTVVE